MFENITTSPVDPIFKVMARFKADPRADKVDLGIGILRNSDGNTPVMTAVKQAEQWLQRHQASKAYLGPAGASEFTDTIKQLIYPTRALSPQLAAIQTPGGTAALRVAGDLLNYLKPGSRIWLSDPPWVTHRAIFPAAGLQLAEYRYLSKTSDTLDFDGMLADMNMVEPGDAVLLQVAGHNPTGVDLSPAQWHQVSHVLADRGAIPVLDLAYHGLAQTLESDCKPLEIVANYHDEWLTCYSCSKTFGLYNDRTGALLIHSANTALTKKIYQEALNRICGNYYMPPNHGAAVVNTIMDSAELKSLWQLELKSSQRRISRQRTQLVERLQALAPGRFDHLHSQLGLFNYLNLDDIRLQALADKYGIYLGAGGRINMSGLNRQNMDQVSQAIAAVCGEEVEQKMLSATR